MRIGPCVFDQDDDNTHGDWAITVRVTGTPLVHDDGDKLMHLGIAASYRGSGDDDRMTRYRARPEIRSVDRFVNTGWLPQSGSTGMVGFEAAKQKKRVPCAQNYMHGNWY